MSVFEYAYGFICSIVLLVVYAWASEPEQRRALRTYAWAAGLLSLLAAVFAFAFPLDVLGWYGSVASALVYGISFTRIYESRSTECVSVMLNVGGFLSNCCQLYVGYCRNDVPTMYNCMMCLSLTATVLLLCAYEAALRSRRVSLPTLWRAPHKKAPFQQRSSRKLPERRHK